MGREGLGEGGIRGRVREREGVRGVRGGKNGGRVVCYYYCFNYPYTIDNFIQFHGLNGIGILRSALYTLSSVQEWKHT